MSIHRIATKLRRLLARRPGLYWLAVVVASLLLAFVVRANMARVDAARERWGATTQVWVTSSPIDAGTPVGSSVVATAWPVAMVSPEAWRVADGRPGGVARHALAVGEVVTSVDVTSGDGPLALTPDAWLVVTVVESPSSDSRVGDEVAVATDGVVLAADARVVDTGDGTTMVAVPADVAPLVAAASQSPAGVALLRQP